MFWPAKYNSISNLRVMFGTILGCALALMVSGCSGPLSSPQTQLPNDTGSLTIVAAGSENLFAQIGPVSAEAMLSRNNQLITFSLSVAGNTASGSLSNIYTGDWLLTVNVKDSAGTVLYSGQSQIRIAKDQVREVSIALTPQPGILNLTIDLSDFPDQELVRKARLYLDGAEVTSMQRSGEDPYLSTTVEVEPKSYDMKVCLYGDTLHSYNLIYEGLWERIDIHPGDSIDMVWSPALGGLTIIGSIDSSPQVPSGLSAISTGSAVQLSWVPVNDVEGDLEGYRIYGRCDEFELFALLGEVEASVTSWEHVPEEWVSQTVWEYVVTAFDLAGNESLRSEPVSVTLQ